MKIAIASGKGGTGKTFVSTNLFYVAGQSQKDVVLIDCDAEAPNVSEFFSGHLVSEQEVVQLIPVIDQNACAFCGKCFDYCHYNAIFYLPQKKMIQLTEELCHSCGACVFACNFDAISEKTKKIGTIKKNRYQESFFYECRTEVGTASSVPVIKQGINQVASHSLVLLDAPPGISCPFIATVETVDFVLLVTEPTPFGLHDLQLSIETLRKMNKPFGVVINKAGLGDDVMYDWLKKENISVLLEIPFDKQIAKTYSEGKILLEHSQLHYNQFFSLMQYLETIKKEVIA